MATTARAGALIASVAVGVLASCGGSSADRPSSLLDVQRAIDKTANASSFVVNTPGVEVIFHAPDTVQQVEHGQSQGLGSGGEATRGDSVITKVFIADRYYEATSDAAGRDRFIVEQRCP